MPGSKQYTTGMPGGARGEISEITPADIPEETSVMIFRTSKGKPWKQELGGTLRGN